MIHGLRIKDGKATYVSRYVRTSRLKQEEYFGGAKFMRVGSELHKFFPSSGWGITFSLARLAPLWFLIMDLILQLKFLVNTI